MNAVRPLLAFFLLLFTLIASYWHVVNVPFYLDDLSSIINNPHIHPPLDYTKLFNLYGMRAVAYVFLALEYAFFQDQAVAYHLVSVSIHLVNTLLFWLVLRSLPKRFQVQEKYQYLMVLLFALHPLNSQAVVYATQQIALLASCFYLCAVLCFIHFRQQQGRIACSSLLGMIFFSVLAMLTKQNTLSLLLVILLVEWVFFGSVLRRMFTLYLFGTLGLMTFGFIYFNYDLTAMFQTLDMASRETQDISRQAYLYTQGQVVWRYVFQFFYPITLQLEYDFALKEKLDVYVLIALLGHLGLIVLACYWRRTLPLVTFGLLFYYSAHLVESSVIPIRDLVFEHRTYLPNIGLSIASIALLSSFADKNSNGWFKYASIGFLCFVLCLCVYRTHLRVIEWGDPLSFYQRETRLAPDNPRVFATLGAVYATQQQCPLAISYIQHALRLYEKQHASNIGIQPEVLSHNIRCLTQLGLNQQAVAYENWLLQEVTDPQRRSDLLVNKAARAMDDKNFEQAADLLEQAIALNPKSYPALINKAITCYNLNDVPCAFRFAEQALQVKPNDVLAQQVILASKPK